MTRSGRRLLGPLGWRLFAAFTLVGVGAVALLAVLAVLSVRSQTTGLVASQREQARRDIAAALAAAYAKARSWQKADLTGVEALVQSTGARLIILDTSGGRIATISPARQPGHQHGSEAPTPGSDHGQPSPQPSHQHRGGEGLAPPPARSTAPLTAVPAGSSSGASLLAAVPRAAGQRAFAVTASPAVTASDRVPVLVDGRRVGTAIVSFPAVSQSPAWQAREAILRAVAAGTVLAVVLAAGAALLVTRRTTRPLTALADAAGALARGEADATARLRPGPGELGQVSAAFARMAGTLRREDELRRALVADTAHELRTPVTILRGATEELLDGLAQPTAGRLTSLHDEILRLERLVDDLSTLAAAQSAALTLERAPADLAKLAAQAADALAPQFSDAALHLDTDLTPVTVTGDPARLTQIITNLLTNAVKFTPPGGRVTLTTRRAGAGAQLTVTDTGPGIPPDELPHIFQRFWRGSAAAGRAGTDIGLAVAAELAAAHGGTITAASPPGGGTTFTLTLPGL
ncbi:MAG: sensor histidine kinase [Gemmatimonadota bacterium]